MKRIFNPMHYQISSHIICNESMVMTVFNNKTMPRARISLQKLKTLSRRQVLGLYQFDHRYYIHVQKPNGYLVPSPIPTPHWFTPATGKIRYFPWSPPQNELTAHSNTWWTSPQNRGPNENYVHGMYSFSLRKGRANRRLQHAWAKTRANETQIGR